MITGIIRGQSLKISAPLIVSDTIDYLQASFCFQSRDWDGADKWAHFSKGDLAHDVRLDESDQITRDKHLNLSSGVWIVYLHGTTPAGMRITTEKAEIHVKETGTINGEPLPEIPLTVAEQIAADAKAAKEIAETVRSDADRGLFNGTNGITPHIGRNGNWWIGDEDTGIQAQGKDYILTEEDLNQITKNVLSALPTWNGGGY